MGEDGAGTLVIEDGGEMRATAIIRFGTGSGSSTLNLLGTETGGRGVLEAFNLQKVAGDVTVNIDGGILRANTNSNNFMDGFGALEIGSEGAWFDSNGYRIKIDAGTTFSGSSSINKIGLGTLVLAGDSSGFAGQVRVEGGTLAIDGGKLGGASGVIGHDADASGAVLVTSQEGAGGSAIASTLAISSDFSVGGNGSGTLTIANGGVVDIASGWGVLGLALNAGSSGRLVIGAAAGGPAASAGELHASEVRFGDGAAGIDFNHAANGYTFAAQITGAGTVDHYAGKTILTGENTYTGATTVHGGTLVIDG